MLNEKKEYTVNELCEHYNISRTTSERWRKYKNLPYRKRGRSVVFIISDVEKWFNENNKEIKYNYENKESSVN